MSDSVENLAEIEAMDAEDAVEPTPQSAAPARCPTCGSDRREQFNDGPGLPKGGCFKPKAGWGGSYDPWHDTEPSSDSPALDDELAPEDIHIHYGPVGGVGVDPAPLQARITDLETSLQLAQGALRETRAFLDRHWGDFPVGWGAEVSDLDDITRRALPPTSPTGEEEK